MRMTLCISNINRARGLMMLTASTTPTYNIQGVITTVTCTCMQQYAIDCLVTSELREQRLAGTLAAIL